MVGVVAWDRLLADVGWRARLWRSWLVGVGWLAPATLWVWDLTPPGYPIVVVVLSAFVAAAGAAVPSQAPWRWVALPAALVLLELARASFPFGGLPLATLAMGQAAGPLGLVARVGTAAGVAAALGASAVAVSAASDGRWKAAWIGAGVALVAVALSLVAPAGTTVGELRFAVVQGGGEQGTRASETDPAEVLERHVSATRRLEGPLDLVLWPENVVTLEGLLAGSPAEALLQSLAVELQTTLVVGVTERDDDDRMRNAAVAFGPDGVIVDRYDKVRRVPFGEYVPLRPLVEALAGTSSGMPRTDAVVGSEPAVVETEAGPAAVAISWEVFFTDRVREGVELGGQVVLNPTNGSSYWLTQVQAQQVASSQLRALETGRWVLQAAPTGFSAVVDSDGHVLARSGVGETWVHQGTAEMRSGATIATRLGPAVVGAAAAAALAAAWAGSARRRV